MHSLLLALAPLLFLAAAIIGTDALGRPLTDEERRRFGALLEEHDYPGLRLVALRFALKLTRNKHRAQDLMGRADLRFVRTGWDPSKVDLVRCLCRLVWSEWTNAKSETEAARKAEEGFLRELEATDGLKLARATPPKSSESGEKTRTHEWAVPSHEEKATELEVGIETAINGRAKLAKLKVMFEKAGDEVNLLWLNRQLDDGKVKDPQTLAAETGRPVQDFYVAAKRRKRAILQLLANERGVEWVEEEHPRDA